MSYVDIVIIALIVLFGTIGVLRGAQKSALSVGAFLISFIVAFFLANTVAEAFLNLEPVRKFVMGDGGVSIYSWLQRAIPGTAGTSGSFIDLNYYQPIIKIVQQAATGMPDADALALCVSFNIFSAIIGVGLFIVVRLLLTIVTMIVKSYIPKKKSALNRLGGFFIGVVQGLEWTLALTIAFSVIGGIPLVRATDAEAAQFLPLTVIEQVYSETASDGYVLDEGEGEGEVVDPDDGSTDVTDPDDGDGEGEVVNPNPNPNPGEGEGEVTNPDPDPDNGDGETPPTTGDNENDGDDNGDGEGEGETPKSDDDAKDPIAEIEAHYEKSVFAKYVNIAAYAIKNSCFLPKPNAFDRLVRISGYVVSDKDKEDPDDLFGDKLRIYCGLGNLNYTKNVYTEDEQTTLLAVDPDKDGFLISTEGYSEYAFRETIATVMSFNAAATDNVDTFKNLIKDLDPNQYAAYEQIIYGGSTSIRALWNDVLGKISAYDDAIADARLAENITSTEIDSINNDLNTKYNEIVGLFNQIVSAYEKVPLFGTLELGEFPSVYQLENEGIN